MTPLSAVPGEPHGVRAVIARVLGVDAARRDAVLSRMLEQHARDAVHYWLQLLLAMGIATMGLVLNSTAVVIGAMLVSPLMGPIINLGMGLVVSSTFLVVRAAVRGVGSVAAVVGAAALITTLLPFHEFTPEIAARTTPTLLDLLVAVLCALTAALSAVRNSSDATSTAAGTAIGIALVPPLCVVGYGLGTGSATVARGASLLFTANFSAIVLFAMAVFYLLSFDRAPIAAIEAHVLRDEGTSPRLERLALKMRDLLGARYAGVWRVIMPASLVVVVYFPLRGALEEVAWQVRVRAGVQAIVSGSAVARNAVRSYVAVERHAVDIRLVIVARDEQAESLQRELRSKIARIAGIEPAVEVVAVPDYGTLRQTVVSLEQPRVPPPEPPRPPDIPELRRCIASELEAAWPSSARPIIAWGLTVRPAPPSILEVEHMGDPPGAAAEALLARWIERERGIAVIVRAVPIPSEERAAPLAEGTRWLPTLVRAAQIVARLPTVRLCVTLPAASALLAVPAALEVSVAAETELARAPADRVTVARGDRWSARLTTTPCPAPPAGPPAADAGTGDVPGAR